MVSVVIQGYHPTIWDTARTGNSGAAWAVIHCVTQLLLFTAALILFWSFRNEVSWCLPIQGSRNPPASGS